MLEVGVSQAPGDVRTACSTVPWWGEGSSVEDGALRRAGKGVSGTLWNF